MNYVDISSVYSQSWSELVARKIAVDDALGGRELLGKDVVLAMPCTLPDGLPFGAPMEESGVEIVQMLPDNHSRRLVYIGRRVGDNDHYCLVMPPDFERELTVDNEGLVRNLVWLLGRPHRQPAPALAGQT